MNTLLHILAGALIPILAVSPISAADLFPLHASILPRTTPHSQGQFGRSVAANADYVVIAAPGTIYGTEESFGVVFVHNATTGALVATLKEPSPAYLAAYPGYFGASVAIEGSRVVVGAILRESGGGVYIYDLSSATPAVPVLTLQNPSPAVFDYFGSSVAIAGNRVVVGAPHDNSVSFGPGAAYVFDLTSAEPTLPVDTIYDPDPGSGGEFGSAVAISGDRVVIGAQYGFRGVEPGSSVRSGVAYVYRLGNSPPAQPVLVLNYPRVDYARFGAAVTIDGNRVAVGAPRDGTAGHHAGAVCVYDLGSATPAMPMVLDYPGPQSPHVNFGTSVALAGNRLAVGTSSWDAVYIYNLASATPTVPAITVPSPTPAFDSFGFALALVGDRLIVGAPYDDDAGYDSGAVYTFELSSAEPAVPVRTLYTARCRRRASVSAARWRSRRTTC